MKGLAMFLRLLGLRGGSEATHDHGKNLLG